MVKINGTTEPTTIDSLMGHFVMLHNRLGIEPALNQGECVPEHIKGSVRYGAFKCGYEKKIEPPINFVEIGIPVEDRQTFWNWYNFGQGCRRTDDKKE